MAKDIEYYLNLPYTKVLIVDDDGSVFAKIEELHGCITVGDDPDDALEMLEDALQAWLEVALEMDMEIPEPNAEEEGLNAFVVFKHTEFSAPYLGSVEETLERQSKVSPHIEFLSTQGNVVKAPNPFEDAA